MVVDQAILFNSLTKNQVSEVSEVTQSFVSNSATPWSVAYQAPLTMGFSRQEYWSGLPFPSPGDLPNPGIEPGSPTLQVDGLPSELPGKLQVNLASNWTVRLGKNESFQSQSIQFQQLMFSTARVFLFIFNIFTRKSDYSFIINK